MAKIRLSRKILLETIDRLNMQYKTDFRLHLGNIENMYFLYLDGIEVTRGNISEINIWLSAYETFAKNINNKTNSVEQIGDLSRLNVLYFSCRKIDEKERVTNIIYKVTIKSENKLNVNLGIEVYKENVKNHYTYMFSYSYPVSRYTNACNTNNFKSFYNDVIKIVDKELSRAIKYKYREILTVWANLKERQDISDVEIESRISKNKACQEINMEILDLAGCIAEVKMPLMNYLNNDISLLSYIVSIQPE